MRFARAAAVLCLVFRGAPAVAAEPPKPPEAVTVIRAGVLIDGTSAAARHDQVVVVRGNRIESVGDAATAKVPEGARVVDLSHATVLPGLIDSHTHIFLQGEDPAEGGYDAQLLKHPLAYRAARATVSARRALEQGFTTHPGRRDGGRGLRRRRHQGGDRGGLHPGAAHVRRHARDLDDRRLSARGLRARDHRPEGGAARGRAGRGAQGGAGAARARRGLAQGLHDAPLLGGQEGQPRVAADAHVDEIKAVVDEAHGWGRKVACHAYNGVGLQRALDGGCDSIEHGLELDDAAVAQMVKQGTWYCPTMSVYYEHWSPAGTPAGERDRKRVALHGPSFAEGAEGRGQDRLRHGRRRLLLDRADRAGVPATWSSSG